MTDTPVVSLDSQLAALLTDLSEVQRKLLALIGEKRTLLLAANVAGLASLQPREQLLIEQLHDCQQRRATLLADAESQGYPHRSLAELTKGLPAPRRQHWTSEIRDARARARLLRHQSLTNWVFVHAHFYPSFADVGDYRDRRPVTSDIWKRRYCRYQWKSGRSGSLDRWAKVCGR